MRRLLSSIVGVVAVAAILIGVNLVVERQLAGAQLDLTAQHLYTLADGTKQILHSLKEPITLRLYYSRELGSRVPVYGAYADRVRELLRDYAAESKGMIKLEFYDPEPYSTTEDRALAYGLQGVPIDQSGEQVYFGLAGSNLLDDERSVGFFQPERERFLEYDLTRLVYELSSPKRAVVGVMTPLPLDGNPRMMMMMQNPAAGQPWASMMQLRQTFSIKTVPLDAQAIDPDIQVLLVAHPQHLQDAALYAIDQFVMRGGRLMVMVDPLSEAQAATPTETGQPLTDTSSDLPKLFNAWGIAYDPKQVIGDLTGAWRVRAAPTDRVQAVDYVPWFNIQAGISHDDPATADLSQITVAAPGAIAKKPGADITFTPLLSTDDKAGPVPLEKLKNFPDPGQILADFKPQGGPYVIAARVHGMLKSAFTGPPDPPKGEDGKPEKRIDDLPVFIAQTTAPANLVVVADSDILADRYWVRMQDFFGQQQATPFSDNGPFVANLIGTLAGGDALIGLRGRGAALHPFTVIDDMQRDAEARYRQTEQQLQSHLDDTEKKLTALRTGRGGGSDATNAVISEQQRTAIDELRRDALATRSKLRLVQLDLRREVNALETDLRLFNIVLVPALLALLAIGLGIARRSRRARART
jgi:ABC-type uncharacterized transport system involved in gliding motility auxiliary subunit